MNLHDSINRIFDKVLGRIEQDLDFMDLGKLPPQNVRVHKGVSEVEIQMAVPKVATTLVVIKTGELVVHISLGKVQDFHKFKINDAVKPKDVRTRRSETTLFITITR